MKINSSTHITILVTFALIFVVIYLYYTITDVRKLSLELKKVSVDVQTLSNSFTKLNGELLEVQKASLDFNKVFNMNDMLTNELTGLLNNQCQGDQCEIKTVQVEQTDIEDDNESVDTTDIKKILNDDDEEPEPEPEPALEQEPVLVQEPVQELELEPVKAKRQTKKKAT
jgi:hypothetical protein